MTNATTVSCSQCTVFLFIPIKKQIFHYFNINPLAIKLVSNKIAPRNHSQISSISLKKQLQNQLKCTMLIPLRHYEIASYISCLLQLVWICHKTCLLGWILHLQRVELRGYLQLEDCQVEDFPFIKINKKVPLKVYLKMLSFPAVCMRA